MCLLVHPTLNIGNTWEAFQQCNSRQADFYLAESKRGKTSHARKLYVLKEEFRAQVVADVLGVLEKNLQKIDQHKDEGYELIGYARKSPGCEERKRRLQNSLLMSHSQCDQVFVPPESSCSESLNNRDLNSSFIGNTADMLAYITTLQA
ncbi:unnamed protein product [Mucor hiemalis]